MVTSADMLWSFVHLSKLAHMTVDTYTANNLPDIARVICNSPDIFVT